LEGMVSIFENAISMHFPRWLSCHFKLDVKG
jgi:hypothetical protein